VAVTGTTGFLGRRVLDTLLKRGLRCRVLLRDGREPPLSSELVTPIRGDLGRPATLATLVDGADVVIHAAAALGTSDTALLHRVNEEGSRQLARAADQAKIRRFVYVSSMAARRPGDGPYAASKEAGQRAVQTFSGTCIILQPPVIYGPGSQVTDAIARLSRLGLVPVIASTAALYPVHVDDIADACVAAATRDDLCNAVLTVPGPNGISLADFTGRVLREIGSRARIVPLPGAISKGLAHAMGRVMARPLLTDESVRAILQGSYTGDFGAAKEQLGFAPRGLDDGLATLR